MRNYGTAPCKDCGLTFIKGSGNTLRCRPCAARHIGVTGIGYLPRMCGMCGNTYKPVSATQKWCIDCRDQARRDRNLLSLRALRASRGVLAKGTILRCADCGAGFTYKQGVQTRCPVCLKANRILQRRAWEKRNPASFEKMERNRQAKAKWYNNKFDGNRKKALERDKRTCQSCGHTPASVVHHKDGRGDNYDQPNHVLDNLVTLCSKCHSALHARLERAFYLRHPETVAQVHAEFIHSHCAPHA